MASKSFACDYHQIVMKLPLTHFMERFRKSAMPRTQVEYFHVWRHILLEELQKLLMCAGDGHRLYFWHDSPHC